MSDRFVPLVSEERAELLGLLARAAGEDWSRSTPCPGWSVKDVVAHLVDGELAFGRIYRGETAELEASDRANEEGVERWRALPGAAVRGALWQHGLAAQRVIDATEGDAWDRAIAIEAGHERLAVSRTTLPLRALVRIHLHELCVHGHDVATALGRAPVWGERVVPLAGYVLRAGPAYLARGLAPEGAIEVEVTGAGRAVVDGRSGAWTIAPDGEAGTRLVLDAETFVLVTAGRLGVAEAIARSAVKGDAAYAERVLGAWRAA